MVHSRQDRIHSILTERFSPDHLEVIDESHRHAGHAGARPEGETHYRVEISAQYFDALNRVAQHRAVMDALDEEFKSGLHALQIKFVSRDGVATPKVSSPDVN